MKKALLFAYKIYLKMFLIIKFVMLFFTSLIILKSSSE